MDALACQLTSLWPSNSSLQLQARAATATTSGRVSLNRTWLNPLPLRQHGRVAELPKRSLQTTAVLSREADKVQRGPARSAPPQEDHKPSQLGAGSIGYERSYPLSPGTHLKVCVEAVPGQRTLSFSSDYPHPLTLHWGLAKGEDASSWFAPPESMWPQGSAAAFPGAAAIQTPLQRSDSAGPATCRIVVSPELGVDSSVAFVLFDTHKRVWLKYNGRENFLIPIPTPVAPPAKPSAYSAPMAGMVSALTPPLRTETRSSPARIGGGAPNPMPGGGALADVPWDEVPLSGWQGMVGDDAVPGGSSLASEGTWEVVEDEESGVSVSHRPGEGNLLERKDVAEWGFGPEEDEDNLLEDGTVTAGAAETSTTTITAEEAKDGVRSAQGAAKRGPAMPEADRSTGWPRDPMWWVINPKPAPAAAAEVAVGAGAASAPAKPLSRLGLLLAEAKEKEEGTDVSGWQVASRRLVGLHGTSAEVLITLRMCPGRSEGGRSDAGPMAELDLVSDCSTPLILHWGVTGAGKDHGWVLPPAEWQPVGSSKKGIACEVALVADAGSGSVASKGVVAATAPVVGKDKGGAAAAVAESIAVPPLQRLRLLLPWLPGSCLSSDLEVGSKETKVTTAVSAGDGTSDASRGDEAASPLVTPSKVCFVFHNPEGTAWYKDGRMGGNFVVTLPWAVVAAPAVEGASGAQGAGINKPPPGHDNAICEAILEGESSDMWTLMHRYNLCYALLQDIRSGRFAASAGTDAGDAVSYAMAAVLCWLRYSASRQITWQRKYNTHPRLLADSQERLTTCLTQMYAEMPQHRASLLVMMTCVGRGGGMEDGQRIRDQILHIMHRHEIKEDRATWMEQWHQKLHNNTTPDDVVICQAFIRYLESRGDIGAYWWTLNQAGLTRERLESFERPITAEPVVYWNCRDGLLADMYSYLHTLKVVHSSEDLTFTYQCCQGWLSGGQHHLMQRLLSGDGGTMSPITRAQVAVEMRAEIHHVLASAGYGNLWQLKQFLYLDALLEREVRFAVEADAGSGAHGGGNTQSAMWMLAPALESLCLTTGDAELAACLADWQTCPPAVHAGDVAAAGVEGARRAMASFDRIRRSLSRLSDETSERLQPIADYLGRAMGVADWARALFSEEMVRAGPAFAVSLVLRRAEPALRAMAGVGAWEIISAGRRGAGGEPTVVRGRVEVIAGLEDVQSKSYPEPVVLVCGTVHGDEDIPAGVVAIVTPDAPDILSHSAVRARNEGVVFASCFDHKLLAAIQGLERIAVKVTPSQGIEFWDAAAEGQGNHAAGTGGSDARAALARGVRAVRDRPQEASSFLGVPLPIPLQLPGLLLQAIGGGSTVSINTSKGPSWCGRYVLPMQDMAPGLVGSKSSQLAALRRRLPAWIQVPASVALPFGTFEAVLSDPINRELSRKLAALEPRILRRPAEGNTSESSPSSSQASSTATGSDGLIVDTAVLAEIRGLIRGDLRAPARLREELTRALEKEGVAGEALDCDLRDDAQWAKAWAAICAVWASKYNDRARLSGHRLGVPAESVTMAVLVQRVVPAEYAFVLHTTNPTTGNAGQVYGELVRGLGETLVGNYPGRALAFTCDKEGSSEQRARAAEDGGDLASLVGIKQAATLSFPSKSVGLFSRTGGTLIFRSDSNAEDLDGYAGAGLYDSVLMDPAAEETLDSRGDPLLRNAGFRNALLRAVGEVGVIVEAAYGGAPQDIEGVYSRDGTITVVQARPQVGL
eukprot:jgi/Mesvir1/24245/Mv10949-RA.1